MKNANQNDPTTIEIMRANKRRYGVGYKEQSKHAAKVFLILPAIWFLSSLEPLWKGLPAPTGFIVLSAIVVLGVRAGIRHMEKTDPVERVKHG